MKPGIEGEQFKIMLNPEYFQKNDILTTDRNEKLLLKVTKVYKYNWWRRLLVWLGYPRVKMFTGVRVKPIDNGKG